MKSPIFSQKAYVSMERDTLALLSSQSDFLTPNTLSSTRAAGDAIQDILARNFDSILGNLVSEYSTDFARRAMADLKGFCNSAKTACFSIMKENRYEPA